MPLRICFAAAELAPLAKAGGLADVTAALVKYLHAAGHDVRLFMPAYSHMQREGLEIYPVDFLQNVPLQLGAYAYEFSVLTAKVPGTQAFVYLIDCPACYDRGVIYSLDPDEHRRFLVLTHAAFMCCQRMAFAPQIMHFHDWHTAIGTLLLRSNFAWDRLFHAARSVLTIHNIGYQGTINRDAMAEVLGTAPVSMLDQEELAAGRIGLLRTGLAHADLITAVSPTYASEIQGPEYGMGLEGLLRARADRLVGVLNGVDYDVWDPRRDHYLPRNFGATQLDVKAELKQQFLQRLGLEHDERAHVPLIGIVSRLVTQKGVDLMVEALPPLLASRRFTMAVLGTGDAPFEDFFVQLARSYPTRVHFHRGYSDELAHWIEAASDMFLMPSQYEPCGLNQLYSLRYGTVPIVRRTGGLADSVQPFDPGSGRGTGIVFEEYSAAALSRAVQLALDLYQDRLQWRQVIQHVMAQDFSWRRQVQRYVELYEQLART
jgi:starch synthase